MKCSWRAALTLLVIAVSQRLSSCEEPAFDETTREQAKLEGAQLAGSIAHTLSPAMVEFRRTALEVEYSSQGDALPGYLYKPTGEGPFRAMIWNHGSEKNPRAQPELARFYTALGYVFFAPIRHGHGAAPGSYIGDLQDKLRAEEKNAALLPQKLVQLHDDYNRDVVAAVAWLREQAFVDSDRMVMSGVSYGGIQTLIAAEKGLGLRAFVPFAPGAMSFANPVLRKRMVAAAQNARAPVFVLQAKNDFSTGPSELLAAPLARLGPPSRTKLYDPFGTSREQGHGAFACWSLGATVWGHDVVDFLNTSLNKSLSDEPPQRR